MTLWHRPYGRTRTQLRTRPNEFATAAGPLHRVPPSLWTTACEAGRWLNATFDVALPAGLTPVAAEETYLEQILRNLVGNAAKYGGGEGNIRIAAEDTGSSVRVSIADSGPGLPRQRARPSLRAFLPLAVAVATSERGRHRLVRMPAGDQPLNGRMWPSTGRTAERNSGSSQLPISGPQSASRHAVGLSPLTPGAHRTVVPLAICVTRRPGDLGSA